MVSETTDGTDFHREPTFNDLWQSVKSVAGEEVQMETVISALDARTQFGQILKRTEENKERFFISKRGKLKAVLMSMDHVKLRKAVIPGDQLVLTAETVRTGTRAAQCRCKAMVGKAVAAEAQIKFTLVDDDKT